MVAPSQSSGLGNKAHAQRGLLSRRGAARLPPPTALVRGFGRGRGRSNVWPLMPRRVVAHGRPEPKLRARQQSPRVVWAPQPPGSGSAPAAHGASPRLWLRAGPLVFPSVLRALALHQPQQKMQPSLAADAWPGGSLTRRSDQARFDDLTDATHALADDVRRNAGKRHAQCVGAAAIHKKGLAGHIGHVVGSGLRQHLHGV